MRHSALILLLAAGTTAALAQTPAKPAAPAVHHTAATPAASASRTPAGLPPVHSLIKTAFTLRYQEIKLGTGAEAVPGQMYKVLYTGYLGSNGRPDDGHKFDSSDDHKMPLKDKDGKPVMGDDGKPKMADAAPMAFPQGMGRLIPGFDQGFGGMKVGGKRRLFIPWQLAYGAKGRPGPNAANPGIPPKADLIFDIELVEVTEMPAAPQRPVGPGGMNRGMPGRPGGPPTGAPGSAPAPAPAPGYAPAPGAAPGPGSAPNAVPVPVTPPPATTPAPATPPPPPTH